MDAVRLETAPRLVPSPEKPSLCTAGGLRAKANGLKAALTIDVEDWFHILDSPAVPALAEWSGLEARAAPSLERILELLHATGTRATFFWLGWMAERHRDLVRKCLEAGHEIGSHGYAHVLAYEVGPCRFRQDLSHAKALLEDITGKPVCGFRAPGFAVNEEAAWALDVIREVGHEYDSSIFPASHGHGGMEKSPLAPHRINSKAGSLLEFPISAVEILGRRISLFGGGYLRLFPKIVIRWGINRLQAQNRPLIVYLHPREIDPAHPRLRLAPTRRFKCYVNLKSTFPKLHWLCTSYRFLPLADLAATCP